MNSENYANTDKAVIRVAGEEDISLVLWFIKELANYEELLDTVTATEELLREWLFEKHLCEVLICEVEGKPAGFALFLYNYSTFLGYPGIYLEDLYVLPEYRRHGIGHTLMSYLAALAIERGCDRIDWLCLDYNAMGRAFYHTLGAKTREEWLPHRLSGSSLEMLAKAAANEG